MTSKVDGGPTLSKIGWICLVCAGHDWTPPCDWLPAASDRPLVDGCWQAACIANKHDTSTQCLTNVGPPSTTLAQHWSNIGWMSRIYWVLTDWLATPAAADCSASHRPANTIIINQPGPRWKYPSLDSEAEEWRIIMRFSLALRRRKSS